MQDMSRKQGTVSYIFVPTMNGLILDLDFPGQTFPSLHQNHSLQQRGCPTKNIHIFFFQKTLTKVITVLTEYLIHITGFTPWLNFFLGILFNITQSGKIYIQNRKTIKSIVNVQYHTCTF